MSDPSDPCRGAAEADPPPQPPERPLPSDCCGNGCGTCVVDLYEQALERYRAALADWQARHRESGAS
jgi:ferredoxin